ncbi:snoRNA-binding protein [Desmophyllum pertusum]|uniref:H/ACA ribonucleoprotein complex subunit 2 n=1 Tax=Desmophyllum pertusum TaxID=174260 RepID=A0A9W9YL73_9CNID|nr:snoRNA-binding protein [Desmophyllum pertusum]
MKRRLHKSIRSAGYFENVLSCISPQSLYVPTCIANNMARSKDKKRDSENGEGDENKDESKSEEPTADYDELVTRVCAIAKPLAGRKLTKRLYKTVKKASKAKSLRRGVKEVAKALRKGEKGFVVMAGDISPSMSYLTFLWCVKTTKYHMPMCLPELILVLRVKPNDPQV